MILLFTSFTSANDKRPLYKRDFLNLCCEPIGANLSFAYRQKWIPSGTVFQKSVNKRGRIEYQDALIVLCEEVRDESTIYRYHPVRRAKIIEVSEEHGYHTIRFTLNEFFDYSREKNHALGVFQDYITAKQEHPGGVTPCWVRMDDDEQLAVESPPLAWRPQGKDFCARWLPLVDHFRGLSEFSDVVFFCVQEGSGGPPVFFFEAIPKDELGRATYRVRSGTSHKVIVSLQGWNHFDYEEPQLTVNEAMASVSGPFLRQRSAGVEADFQVTFKRSFQPEVSTLCLKVARVAASPVTSPYTVHSPQIQVLVKSGVSWGFLATAVVSLALGGLLAVITPPYIHETASVLGSDLASGLRGHKLKVFIATKALAFILLAVGTFLGFNKLPIK